ncbi:hypothetical protein Q5503_13275, partial [Escherichia coli]|nr:hypothetical protein [Escherichia coli]
MKFMFHSETNLANTDYRENRSMILSGLSLWEKGSPLHESTQQVENLRPDTACGLQAEKTGRFSLHRRDNTRPDKTNSVASGTLPVSDAARATNPTYGISGGVMPK